MRTIDVRAADGTDWTVRVVWQPRWRALARRFGGWRRKRKRGVDGSDVADGADATFKIGEVAGDDLFIAVAVIVGLVVFGLLFWWLLLPLLLLLVDIVVVLVLALLAIPARVLFRRPWTVEACSANGATVTAEVVGWRAALAKRDEMAERLRRGSELLDYAR